MLFSMITINEIPDYFEDQKGGKRNLVVRLGREGGVWLFCVSVLSAFERSSQACFLGGFLSSD